MYFFALRWLSSYFLAFPQKVCKEVQPYANLPTLSTDQSSLFRLAMSGGPSSSIPLTGQRGPFRSKRESRVLDIGGFGQGCFRRFYELLFFTHHPQLFLVGSIAMSVYGAYVLSISRPCSIQDRNQSLPRRSAGRRFCLLFQLEEKSRAGRGQGAKEKE